MLTLENGGIKRQMVGRSGDRSKGAEICWDDVAKSGGADVCADVKSRGQLVLTGALRAWVEGLGWVTCILGFYRRKKSAATRDVRASLQV